MSNFLWGLLVGAPIGVFAYWLWLNMTDGELRQAHHTRQDDEHAIGYPEDSKMKSPDDWPRGGL